MEVSSGGRIEGGVEDEEGLWWIDSGSCAGHLCWDIVDYLETLGGFGEGGDDGGEEGGASGGVGFDDGRHAGYGDNDMMPDALVELENEAFWAAIERCLSLLSYG